MSDETYDLNYSRIIADYIEQTKTDKTGAFFLLKKDAPELKIAFLIKNEPEFEKEFRLRNNGTDDLVFVILPWG